MSVPCDCTRQHEPRRIVLTGGPGAGKTAVLEMVRHVVCAHVVLVPEAAAIDARIFDAWQGHPRRFIVDATPDFVAKARRSLALVRAEIPDCCRADSLTPAADLSDGQPSPPAEE